jgi:hypothetical protein
MSLLTTLKSHLAGFLGLVPKVSASTCQMRARMEEIANEKRIRHRDARMSPKSMQSVRVDGLGKLTALFGLATFAVHHLWLWLSN